MARKITEEAIHAFMVYVKPFHKSNMSVMIEKDVVILRLHGHQIARREVGSNTIEVTNAGYFTNTTKERLNGLPGVSIQQKKGVWFLNGVEWSGEWTKV
jgi:hypothetical protein